jgi:hypothetical protein
VLIRHGHVDSFDLHIQTNFYQFSCYLI